MVTRFPSSPISTLQASRLRPLIRIASEPQMPCAHDRRYVNEPSWLHLILFNASSTRSFGSTSTVYSLNDGLTSVSGLYRLMRSVASTWRSSPVPCSAVARDAVPLVLTFFRFERRDRHRLLAQLHAAG